VRPSLLAIVVIAAGCGNARDSADGSGSTSPPSTGLSQSAGDDGDGTGQKLDAASGVDLDGFGGPCGPDSGAATGEFSYVWIANSPDGTVSKIDTRTGDEIARYRTGPGNGTDDPSRTSVDLAGDVAVSNRSGSISKFAGIDGHCVDADGDGAITTSTGPDDVLPFGDDECLLWNRPLGGGGGGNQQGPRPTAWDAGAGGDPCDPTDDRVWVGWFDIADNRGRFLRLHGADGSTLDDVFVPAWDISGESQYGPYGGATDADGNLWVIGLGGPLARVDAQTLVTNKWEVPEGASPYGIALGADGTPWTAGLGGELLRFDLSTSTFSTFQIGGQLRGVQIDRDGFLWAAVNGTCGVMKFNTATKTVVSPVIPIEGCVTPVGVSIDVDGYVWLPDQGANAAFKFDPVAGTAVATAGLIGPYTYSDMTGSGLGLVVYPPG
jgi:DNA-binding beta-propeller fold protein YncE